MRWIYVELKVETTSGNQGLCYRLNFGGAMPPQLNFKLINRDTYIHVTFISAENSFGFENQTNS